MKRSLIKRISFIILIIISGSYVQSQSDNEIVTSDIIKSVKITSVVVKNTGENAKSYSENFKGIIKAGDFSKGPWMPKIECRAFRKDDLAKTASTAFRWRLESRLKEPGFPITIYVPDDVDTDNDNYLREDEGYIFHESKQVKTVNDHDENIWLVNWKKLFVGGLITLVVEADVDGDGIIETDERDEISGEIIAEKPKRADVMRLFASIGDNPPGILKAIADHESNGINQFDDGYPVINRNPETADCGFMQINTLYWPNCLVGPKYQGLWNWKDNIRAGKYIFDFCVSETYKKLSTIIYDLLMPYHYYDPVPYKFKIPDVENLYLDFLLGEKFWLSVLTRYNGSWHLKDHPDENEFYQPGVDFRDHIVYYGEYYHPEITGNAQKGWKVKWGQNEHHYEESLIKGIRYANDVYFEHYLK